jgi:head-tail adaptor
MIRAGELREKISIDRPIRTPLGGGASDATYMNLLNTFAMVVEERSDPEMIANQENIVNYVHFKIRYRPEIYIKLSDRLTWRGFYFIVNNIKVSALRSQIDIYVNSEMETSRREVLIGSSTFGATFDATFN